MKNSTGHLFNGGYTESKIAEDEHPYETFYNERFPTIEDVFEGLNSNEIGRASCRERL